VLNFLYDIVSWVLLRWHQLFTAIGIPKGSGLNWALSIMFLVVTARVLLFRLFIKQVHYQRKMQEMQPKIQKLRDKHKNDKAELQREMMKLQQEEGFNPLSGCLPLLLQWPVFIGLFHVLHHLANSVTLCNANPPSTSVKLTLYTFSRDQTCDAAKAKLFKAPLAASFHDSNTLIHDALGGDVASTRIVLVVLLIISAAATMGTQLLARANATVTPEGTTATIQKAMLYLIPIGVLASGLLFNFPLGVLLYWFVNNLWTLGQQAYIIRYHPQPTKDVVVVGELGKTVRPAPGARPNRDKTKTSLVKTTEPADAAESADGDVPDDAPDEARRPNGSAPPPSTTPRPGQRPNRNNGRPAAKRPTQSKKRR